MTAGQLAQGLDVTERTILRDVDALSEAGVPIFTTRGGGGGIELTDGFQTHLTGLTTEEARCLYLVGQPRVAHRLGLGVPTRATRSKLLAAIGPALAAEADQLESWFLHDPDPGSGHRIPHGELRRLGRSIRRGHRVDVIIDHDQSVGVRPLGLVLKAGSWHLVVMGEGGPEVLCIDRIRATRLTNETFVRPAAFDLSDFWRAQTGQDQTSRSLGLVRSNRRGGEEDQ